MDEYSGNPEIYERFLDAAAALVMDQYGAAVADSVSRTAAEPVEIPEALDKKCRKLIREKLPKERRVRFAKKAMRFTVAAALCVVMLFGVTGILFITVEAVRIPIINFFIEQKTGYAEFGAPVIGRENTGLLPDEVSLSKAIGALLPLEYRLVLSEEDSDENTVFLYMNAAGESITVSIDIYNGVYRVDTEDAAFTETIVLGANDAYLISKNGYRMIWIDEKSERVYQLSASNLAKEDVIELAQKLEKIF